MPWVRYFFFGAAALIGLLFISDAFLPKEAVAVGPDAAAERPMVRIQSDQRWPERIVMDTSQPTISPPQTVLPVVAAAPKAVADIDTTTAPMEAYAQMQSVAPKKPDKAIKKARIAKVHRRLATDRQSAMASAQVPGFNFFSWR
jgi:hypothetical protein